ncbi:dehydrogenase/reductase SDR family member 4 isoform X1 [Cephus cinctus]|uniref:Dehydrogenase/reductase SDR family member 4 isoform X1 n=1 Tax=Cephus cinctus TaxID=211228 RepID=A0AAJ7CEP3_CEPCN|nr:dehydrogenase/reductase SDR family member 4 isoform X1 [Cephus cinctus]XP_015608153.1 dehydrogenase/reductase SDR family member 4 isoform X1 [Cephus cinctus]
MLRTVIVGGIRYFTSSAASTMSCQRLKGKVAVVTASTDGIGFSVARRLAQEGAKVMISSRKEVNVKKAVDQLVSEGLSVSGIVCHVGKSDDRRQLLNETKSKYGGLDILVSNAAVNPVVSPIFDCAEEVWDKIMDINVKSTFLLMKEFLPLLRESKTPSIVIMSSVAAYDPFNLLGVYSISKTALVALCKASSEELATDGIRVNCIAPGIIRTKFSKPLYESEAANEIAMSRIAMQRIGLPEEISGIAAFLASDDSSYITGETIVASGGMSSRL